MSTKLEGTEGPIVESRDDLVAYLEAGSKPPADWRIGTEHEKFAFHTDDYSPVAYQGERSVHALLEGLVRSYGWEPIVENGNVIALRQPDCPKGGSISLEPGGQFELSGAPLKTLHQTCSEVHGHLAQVRDIGGTLGIGFLGLGFSPKWTLAETPAMPKERYGIMARYMPKVGRLGLDMMFRTCTVQVNVDFADEADMVKKMQVGLALQPLATALFANSPFTDGKPNGFLSYRAEIWRYTDADRTGLLPFVFEPGFGFERYVDYALDVPMYFLYRQGRYIDVAGASFRDFLAGKLSALPDERPTLDDFADHLTTLFPEVRLKRFLEMRGADAGPWRRLCALPAFWVGLLYHPDSLDAAARLVGGWSEEERHRLRDMVPRLGLATPFREGTLLDVAREVLAISQKGLAARSHLDSHGQDEREYLAPVEETIAEGRPLAQHLLDSYHKDWKGNIDRLFQTYAF
jgi:glutamate--cysteine ligase